MTAWSEVGDGGDGLAVAGYLVVVGKADFRTCGISRARHEGKFWWNPGCCRGIGGI